LIKSTKIISVKFDDVAIPALSTVEGLPIRTLVTYDSLILLWSLIFTVQVIGLYTILFV